jgi:large subunit ribosomal protein L29
MKQSEIKDLSAAGCKKLSLTKKTYADLKCSCYFSIENPLQIRSVRRTVARLATELTKRVNNCNLLKDGRKKKFKKREVGVVTSDKMDKSIVVAEVRK